MSNRQTTIQGLIVSGPPGSGKSTLAAALCGSTDNCVHLQTDQFFAAIRTGFISPWLEAAAQQNRTVVSAIAAAAAEFAAGGYFVVLDGVVLPWAREIYDRTMHDAGCEFGFLALLPTPAETMRRGLSRPVGHGLTAEVYQEMHRQFEAAGFAPEEMLDSTALSADEVVRAVQRRFGIQTRAPGASVVD